MAILFIVGDSPRSVFAEQSDLWGQDGKSWTPQSRLPDFSYAGYHSGEVPIPTIAVKKNVVTDFGADGEDDLDDTEAFRKGIAGTKGGALFIPAGHYRIEDILEIKKSNFVLRGAGQESTILYFPKSLGEIRQLPAGRPYGGGGIVLKGKRKGEKLTAVTHDAKRGDRSLRVSSAAGLVPGNRIRLRMTNPPDNSLSCHMFAERSCLSKQRQGRLKNQARKTREGDALIDWVADIESISDQAIILSRPLRVDVNVDWNPEIWTYKPTLTEVGIEDLAIVFPDTQYAGHQKEAGFHAIHLNGAAQSWVRRVTIQDADRGIEITGEHNTISEVTLTTHWRKPNWGRDGASGHYGFQFLNAQDTLVHDSRITSVFVHNMAVAGFSNGNVYSKITSELPLFDHHHSPAYENLFTEIVLTRSGEGLLRTGGVKDGGAFSGARSTLWNIRALKGDFSVLGSADEFPQMNMVGVDVLRTTRPSHASSEVWVESWPGEKTMPPNLYQAQLTRRMQEN